MSRYPLSAHPNRRQCGIFYCSGATPGSACPIYPCMHTVSRDLDWLEDQEDQLKNRKLYDALQEMYHAQQGSVNIYRDQIPEKAFNKIQAFFDRRRRLDEKSQNILTDLQNHTKRRWA